MSLTRYLRRAAARKNGIDWPTSEAKFRMHKKGGGYDVLHPTKGWRRVSGKRLGFRRAA